MNVVFSQFLQPRHGLLHREAPIGINAQFYLLAAVAFANKSYQYYLPFPVDGSNLQFHASESCRQFFFNALVHLLERTHPHQSVDGNGEIPTPNPSRGEGSLICF